MAWYNEAIFYHIYPLGLLGAPKENEYGKPQHRLPRLNAWVKNAKKLGATALLIGPVFESASHGYDTTDYAKVDVRLGTNADLKKLVEEAHQNGQRVILDAVYNHVGRDFWAFKDVQKNREQSPYVSWFSGINFNENNYHNDGFSYDTWRGYDILVRLNLENPEVRSYLIDQTLQWIKEFDIDGLRLDSADVLNFDFMRELRSATEVAKPDFWLMGEVIHGEYNRWEEPGLLHAVTNYSLHQGLFNAHNTHNYFEIAHTTNRNLDLLKDLAAAGQAEGETNAVAEESGYCQDGAHGDKDDGNNGNGSDGHGEGGEERGGTRSGGHGDGTGNKTGAWKGPGALGLYNFVDNQDVSRIASKVDNRANLFPIYTLIYTLPGVPSLYYGSEFGIDGARSDTSDEAVRPKLSLSNFKGAEKNNPLTALLVILGKVRTEQPALSYGEYRQLYLTNEQYAFARITDTDAVIIAVNNADTPSTISVDGLGRPGYTDEFTGDAFSLNDWQVTFEIPAHGARLLTQTGRPAGL